MAWTQPPKTWSVGELVTAALLNTHLRDMMSAVLPIGTLIYRVTGYADTEVTLEGRWLYCNGFAVSRTTYAELFAYFNALTPALPFGSGNGTTTFNLPDLRGRAPWGIGTAASVDTLGENEGAPLTHRSVKHRHTLHFHDTSGASGEYFAPAGKKDTTNLSSTRAVGTNDPDHPLDNPAYLVAGGYFVKYVS